ncbi:MAG: hypothetical protein ACIALR_07070 [Blastopirellula sp. JB062]
MRRRALISLLLIANIIFLSFGVRFRATVVQDLSIPFPCQGGSCGCRDADTCWNHCCCNSAAERLAWAEANGVTPPENVLARLLQEAAILKAVNDETAQAGSCCAAKRSSCCKKEPIASCCSDQASDSCQPGERKAAPAASQPYRGPFFTVSRCGGLPELFAIFSSTVVEGAVPSWSPRLDFYGYLFAYDVSPSSTLTTPATPPPDAISA